MAVLAAWSHFWFAPGPPLYLGLCRITFFSILFGAVVRRDLAAYAEVSPVFWRPTGLFRIFNLGRPDPTIARVLQRCWKASLVLCALGLFTPVSSTVALLLGFYLPGLRTNLAFAPALPQFPYAPMVIILGAFALADGGVAPSLDALLFGHGASSAASGEYTWPIRVGQVMVALMFFSAGGTKLRVSGWRWCWSDQLARLFSLREARLIDGLVDGSPPLLPGVPTWLARMPFFCRLLGMGTLAIELAYPAALTGGLAQRLIVPSGMCMMISFAVLMGVPIIGVMLAYHSFWIPWPVVAGWLIERGWVGAPT